MKQLRLFFATDLHGSERCFRKFTHAARVYEAQVVILGGDLTGKAVTPIVRGTGGRWESQWNGTMHRPATEEELTTLEDRIRQSGYYPYRCDREEYQLLADSPERQAALFRQLMRQTFRRWLELAEERLSPLGVPCPVILGNDDDPELIDCFAGLSTVRFVEEQVVDLPGGYQLLGLGYSTPTPWHTPRELPEEEIARRMTGALSRVADPGRLILNVHCPPYNSTLDLAPALNADLQIQKELGEAKMVPVGSRAVRAAIEQFQPLLGLHGHVHESRSAVRIGRTLAINPGSDYGEGVLRGAIINLQGDRVLSYQMVAA